MTAGLDPSVARGRGRGDGAAMTGLGGTGQGGRETVSHPPVAQLDALTALRFLAAAYVVLFHYDRFFFPDAPRRDWILLGFSGVTFFFVLSGFILAHTYRAVDLADPAARARFYRARAARIAPLYLVSLLLGLPWFLAWVMKSTPPLQPLLAMGGVLAPLGLHAWLPGAACSLNCPSWSISVEVLFYVLFPVLLPLVLRRPGAYAVAALALWCVFAAFASLLWSRLAPGVSLIEPEPGGTLAILLAQAIKYDPLLHLPAFLAGLALYALFRDRRLPVPALLAASGAAFLLLLAAFPFVPQPAMHTGLTVLVWAPLILAGAAIRRGPLVSAPLVYLGRISFAVYLVHTPAYAVVGTLDRALLHGRLAANPALSAGLAVALTLAAAVLLHHLVEEPARRRILRGARPRPALAAAAAE